MSLQRLKKLASVSRVLNKAAFVQQAASGLMGAHLVSKVPKNLSKKKQFAPGFRPENHKAELGLEG